TRRPLFHLGPPRGSIPCPGLRTPQEGGRARSRVGAVRDSRLRGTRGLAILDEQIVCGLDVRRKYPRHLAPGGNRFRGRLRVRGRISELVLEHGVPAAVRVCRIAGRLTRNVAGSDDLPLLVVNG